MKLSAILSGVFALSAVGISYRVTASPSYGYQGPAAPLAHDGTVLDTPEVAQAKAAHLAAHAAAVARATHGHHYDQGYYGYHNEQPPTAYERISYNAPHYQGYHGSQAPLAHDGRVVDTPEVAQAKAAHLAAHAHAAARIGHYRGYEDDGLYRGQVTGHGYVAPVQVAYAHAAPVGYHGSPAPLGHDGRVIDTPEVAQARAAHLEAYAHAAALASSHRGYPSDEAPSGGDHSSAEGPSQEESYY